MKRTAACTLGAAGASCVATAACADVVALRGGTVHPVSGPEQSGATVVIDGRSHHRRRRDVAIPADARVVDVNGSARLSSADRRATPSSA